MLTVENGEGIPAADSYAAAAAVLAYWVKRPHDALAAIVAAADPGDLDGAAREATSFMDAVWGPYYRGERAGYVQGLLIPRSKATDDAGYPLPALPPEVVAACCELTARALSGRLQPDIDLAARVKSEQKKVGPLEKKIEYFDASAPDVRKRFGFVETLLAPILNGSQPGAPSQHWGWS